MGILGACLDLLVVSGLLIAMARYYTCEGDVEESWAAKIKTRCCLNLKTYKISLEFMFYGDLRVGGGIWGRDKRSSKSSAFC